MVQGGKCGPRAKNFYFFFFFSGALDPEKKKRDPSGDFGPSQFFLSFFLKGEREGMGVGG